jgi:hypothetical protein
MPVAGGVSERLALAFVAVVEGECVLVRLETLLRGKVLFVAGDLGDTNFIDIPIDGKTSRIEPRGCY